MAICNFFILFALDNLAYNPWLLCSHPALKNILQKWRMLKNILKFTPDVRYVWIHSSKLRVFLC